MSVLLFSLSLQIFVQYQAAPDRLKPRVQCISEKDDKAVETLSGDFYQTENGEAGAHFSTKVEEAIRVCRAEKPEKSSAYQRGGAAVLLFFAKTAPQLGNKKERKEVENINRQVSDVKSDASELVTNVKRIDDCKQIWDDTREEQMAEKDFTNPILERGSTSFVSGSVLDMKDVLAVFRRQMERGSLRGLNFQLASYLRNTGLYTGTPKAEAVQS